MSFASMNNSGFGLAVAKGEIHNFSGVTKFGYNPAIGSSAFETVWDGSNTYTYATTATTATATSSNTAADNGGTVEIQGLDQNYDPATETITIGGAASTKQFSRVFRARMVNANTGTANAGTVSITVNSIAVAQITAGYGQTLMCVYTVPRNYNAYISQLDVGSSKDLENEVRLIVREIDNGNAWNTKEFITTRGGFMSKPYFLPIQLSEKTDIEIVAKASATSAISAGFELFLHYLGE